MKLRSMIRINKHVFCYLKQKIFLNRGYDDIVGYIYMKYLVLRYRYLYHLEIPVQYI